MRPVLDIAPLLDQLPGIARRKKHLAESLAAFGLGFTILAARFVLPSIDYFNGRGDLNNHDPLLGPLQNNGGPTATMALLPQLEHRSAENRITLKEEQGFADIGD